MTASTSRFHPLAACICLAFATSVFAQTTVVSAVIRAVDPVSRGITIEIGNEKFGREMTLEPDAAITLNRKNAKLDELEPGMKATILLDVRAKRVQRISARSDEKPTKRSSKEEMPADDEAESEDESSRESKGKKQDDEAIAAIQTTGDCPAELEAVDEIVKRHLVAKRIRGAAVAIVKEGRCVLARGYGHADENESALVEAETLFPVVGVSRVFTAVGILRLSEEGKVKLDDKFVDLANLPLGDVNQNIKDNSPFFKVTIQHMLQNSMPLDQDPFLAGIFRNPEAKMATQMVIAGMPDREGFVFDDDNPFGGVDLQYMLLGRMIAKAAGGRYEPYIKRNVFDALGKSEAKVQLIGIGDVEEKDRAKKRRRSGKAQAEEEPFDGVAQISLGVRDAFEDPSMRIDSSGAWVCSLMDLARFAKAFDDPAKSPILKQESIELMFANPSDAKKADAEGPGIGRRVFAQKRESAPRRKFGGPNYFTCGWSVYSSKGKGDSSSWTARRYVHSGPASIVSEGDRHVVLLFTTGALESKTKGEHPLMRDIDLALDKIQKWPESDYFKGGSTGTPKPAEIASKTPSPAPGAEAMPPGAGLPKAVVPTTTKDQLLAIFSECIALNMEFDANGGQALIRELSINGNNFLAAGKSVPQAKPALEKMNNRLTELITSTLQITATAGASDMMVARELTNYLNLRYKASKGLLDLISIEANDPKVAIQKQIDTEAAMCKSMNAFLQTTLQTYPPKMSAASSMEEFQESIAIPLLFVQAAQAERTVAVNARRSELIAIQAKGAGADIGEQRRLADIYQEIRTVGDRLQKGLEPIQKLASQFVGFEETAQSKYLPAWKAMAALVDAEAAMCGFLAKYGTPEAKPEDEARITTELQEAHKQLKSATDSLNAPGQAAAKP